MFNKIAGFMLSVLCVALSGCAVQPTAPVSTWAPTSLSNHPITHAKKIFLVFDVGLEGKQGSDVGGREGSKEIITAQWKTLATQLVSELEAVGIEAEYEIDPDTHFLTNHVKVPEGVTHVVNLKEVKGTLYRPNSFRETLVEIDWEGTVLQAEINSLNNKYTGKFEPVSVFKYNFAPSQCFLGVRTKEFIDKCLKDHSDFIISNLKKIAVI